MLTEFSDYILLALWSIVCSACSENASQISGRAMSIRCVYSSPEMKETRIIKVSL